VYYDKSKVAALPVVSAIQQVADQYSMQMAGTKPAVPVVAQDITTSSMNYVDFVLPGVIGMTIMMSCVNGTTTAVVKNRSKGIFRKLATTPMSKFEWNASRIITQTITLMLSLAVSIGVAFLLFQVTPQINAITIALIACGGVLFAGLGTLLTVVIKDEEAAVFGASAITFPLMFVSGSFVSLDTLPGFLKDLAAVSPLTYLNNGLRSAMVTGNMSDAGWNLAVVAIIAAVLFTLGVVLLKWKDD
jgi:ABC-2 type transport system permease protein